MTKPVGIGRTADVVLEQVEDELTNDHRVLVTALAGLANGNSSEVAQLLATAVDGVHYSIRLIALLRVSKFTQIDKLIMNRKIAGKGKRS